MSAHYVTLAFDAPKITSFLSISNLPKWDFAEVIRDTPSLGSI
jgi:hypothetical protein